jgi:hypothetical protein
MNIRSLKPRRNIKVTELVYGKAGDGSMMVLRDEKLSRSADSLLAFMFKRCKERLWVLRRSTMDACVLYWIPNLDFRRRYEFRFETPLAAAMFTALYIARMQAQRRTRPSTEPASPAPAPAQDAS